MKLKATFKKLSQAVFFFGLFILATAMIPTGTTSAAGPDCSGNNWSDNNILGIPPWYKYLEGEDVEQLDGNTVCQPVINSDKVKGTGQSSLPKGDILLIAAAILEMLSRLAALAAFAYLIYGGFMYLTSSGNPEQVKKAGSTLLNAAIGLGIAISATTFINFFATRLGAS